jgi:hypothetical protein
MSKIKHTNEIYVVCIKTNINIIMISKDRLLAHIGIRYRK